MTPVKTCLTSDKVDNNFKQVYENPNLLIRSLTPCIQDGLLVSMWTIKEVNVITVHVNRSTLLLWLHCSCSATDLIYKSHEG